MASFDWEALSVSMAEAGDLPALTPSQLRSGVESGTVELYVAEEGHVEHFAVLDKKPTMSRKEFIKKYLSRFLDETDMDPEDYIAKEILYELGATTQHGDTRVAIVSITRDEYFEPYIGGYVSRYYHRLSGGVENVPKGAFVVIASSNEKTFERSLMILDKDGNSIE